MVVVGLFIRDNDAATALNNLDEAEFPATSISVITSDPARATDLTDVKGPWSGLSPDALGPRLSRAGMAPADCEAYVGRISAGAACIAVRVSIQTAVAAEEILTDQKAEAVQTLTSAREKGSRR